MAKKPSNPISVKIANTITAFPVAELLTWGFHNIAKTEFEGKPAVKFNVRSSNLKGHVVVYQDLDNRLYLNGYDTEGLLVHTIRKVEYPDLFKSLDRMVRTGGLTELELHDKIFYIDDD